VIGPTGPIGATGAAGATGAVGGILSYGYIYNLSYEVLANANTAQPITFDSAGVLSGVAFTPGGSTMTVANAGTYLITFSVSAEEPNQFAIFVNSTNSNSTSTIYGSGAGTQQNNGSAILILPAGAQLTLCNYNSSAGSIILEGIGDPAPPNPPYIGGYQTAVNASVTIIQLA
jgi:hypothetical protein